MTQRTHPFTALALGSFLFSLGTGAFTFAFPLMALRDSLGLSLPGLAFAGYFAARLAVSPAAGLLADRKGMRLPLTASALGAALSPLFWLLLPQPAALIVIQLCLGLCAGVCRPAAMAAVAACASGGAGRAFDDMGRAFGRYNAAVNLAYVLGPVLGATLFFHRDIRPVLMLLAACMATSAWAFLSVPRTSLPEGQRQPFPRGRTLFRLLPAVAGRTLLTGALAAYYPLLLSLRLPGNATANGLLFALPALAAALLMPLSGRLASRCDKTTLTLGGMFASALAASLLGISRTPSEFAVAGLGIGLGTVLSLPASMALAAERGSRGQIMGVFNFAAGLGFIAGPLLGGLAIRSALRPEAVFPATGVAAACLALPLAALALERRLHFSPRQAGAVATLAGLLLAACVLPGVTAPPKQPEDTFRYADAAMGTFVRLTLDAPDEHTADLAADAAFRQIRALARDLDHRNPAGSVGRVNLAAGKRPARVSPAAFALIRRALEYGRATNGAFDITVGAVTVTPLFFARESAVNAAKRHLVDYRRVRLDEKARTVFLPEEGMALDLGGLAKGFIVDRTAALLGEHGVRAGIVEAGGDLLCFGDRFWTAGIEHPRRPGLVGKVRLHDKGLCGSGDWRRFVDTGEGRRHHILDPASLESARACIGATVAAPRAEQADALATALLVLGPVRGREILAANFPDCAALWLLPDGRHIKTADFPEISGKSATIR